MGREGLGELPSVGDIHVVHLPIHCPHSGINLIKESAEVHIIFCDPRKFCVSLLCLPLCCICLKCFTSSFHGCEFTYQFSFLSL